MDILRWIFSILQYSSLNYLCNYVNMFVFYSSVIFILLGRPQKLLGHKNSNRNISVFCSHCLATWSFPTPFFVSSSSLPPFLSSYHLKILNNSKIYHTYIYTHTYTHHLEMEILNICFQHFLIKEIRYYRCKQLTLYSISFVLNSVRCAFHILTHNSLGELMY